MKAQELEVVEEQAPGGLSRRDLITRTAVAGGLVWAAPVLLASPVAAQTGGCDCASDSQIVFLKVASTEGENCPNVQGTCLEGLPRTAKCDPCLANLVSVSQFIDNARGERVAEITVQSPLQVTQVCAKIGEPNQTFNVFCPTFGQQPANFTVTPGPESTFIRFVSPLDRPVNFLTFAACVPPGTPIPGCPDL